MRRSSWPSAAPVRPARAPLVPLTRPVVYASYTDAPPALAVPKFVYVRSPALLVACRELACQHCGINDGTVVAAHSNAARHGKGRSIKASDVYVASLCARCHFEIDQGRLLSQEDRETMWMRAHRRTVRALVRRRLWPAGVRVPDLEDEACQQDFKCRDRSSTC